jgi:hypothetical protein
VISGGSSLAFKAHRKVRSLAWGGALLLATAIISGCAPPQYTYITNSGNSTYFKVPHSWGQVSSTDLCHQLEINNQTNVCPPFWTIAFEGQPSASASGFNDFGLSTPFVFAQVEPYQSQTGSALTDQTLEDIFVPVSDTAREEYAAEGYELTDFKSLLDTTVTESGGFHGVREVFDYTAPSGETDTFDEVVLTNGDSSDIYVIFLHCTASCYAQDQKTINDVMSSFTVRSN